MNVELYGYQYSVYSWIARLALEEKGASYHWIEINPFAPDIPESYLALHPFKRVPALVHDTFQIYETGAITRYVDEAFPGPRLQPTDPRHRARCSQFLSIIDSYVYWPLVRQVFSHCVFRPRLGRPSDATEIQKGLDAAPEVLAALEQLVPTPNISAAPSYPCRHPSSADDRILRDGREGEALLKRHRKLAIGGRRYQREQPIVPPCRDCLYNRHYCSRS